jgi:hypothetical protein
LEQWQRQTVEPTSELAQHWQFCSKCPLGLRQPATDLPLIAASGTIAQIATAFQRLRIDRSRDLRAMVDPEWAKWTPTF